MARTRPCPPGAPREIILRIRGISAEELRNICKEIGANVSGPKEELVTRIIAHVASGRDIRREPEPPPPIVEPRRLERSTFSRLFSELRGQDLAAILGEFDLRRWGTKDTQIETLWESHRSEETLLNCLSAADLEGLLRRLELKTTGPKGEKIGRALEHFSQQGRLVELDVGTDVAT